MFIKLWDNTYFSSKLDIYSPDYSEMLTQEIKKLEAKTEELERRSQTQ